MIRLKSSPPPGSDVDVLVVCTGNICRSPYIAAALAAAVPALVTAGAGTQAVVGADPVPEVLSALGAADVTPARQLNRRIVRGASFILTATTAHRAEVIRLDPGAESRAFTLKEVARLVGEHRPSGATPQERLSDLARHLRAAAEHDPWDHDDDLEDPYGGDAAGYARMIAEVDAALAVIGPALAGGVER